MAAELGIGEEFPEDNALARYVQEVDLDHQERKQALAEVAKLIELGASPTAAIDAYVLDVLDMVREDWAAIRGVNVQAVERNASRAREAVLAELVGDSDE